MKRRKLADDVVAYLAGSHAAQRRYVPRLAQDGALRISRDDGRRIERRSLAPSFPAAARAATDGGAIVRAGLRGLTRLEIS